MKLYDSTRAPNPRRVRIFLAEKGVTLPLVQVDLMKGEHRAAPFATVNPFQQLPVLELDDGTTISESIAICRYFEGLHPQPPLFGRTPLEVAQIEMWNRRAEHGLMWSVAQCVRHTHPAFDVLERPQVKDWGEVNRARVGEQLALLDRELAQRPFIAGDMFTVADITALVAIDFMRLAKIERPTSLAALARWYAEVAARPSAAA